jgi:hypothetical protein
MTLLMRRTKDVMQAIIASQDHRFLIQPEILTVTVTFVHLETSVLKDLQHLPHV